MSFIRKSVFFAFVIVLMANVEAYAFQSFSSTADSATSISISFELPPGTIEKLSSESDVNVWRELIDLSCKKNPEGGCTPEASAIFEIPSGARNPVIRDAVGTLLDGTVVDCPDNVYQGTVGRWRNKNITTPHVRPLLISDQGETEGFFVRLDFRIVWEGGYVAKGKRVEAGVGDQYFEDSYRDSIVNYGEFPSYTTKGASDIVDVPGFGSLVPGQKIHIRDKGIYRITYEDLKAKNDFKVDELDPRTISMYLRGREIPIYVYGEENGMFEPGEYVEFYGIGDNENPYTRANGFWITYGGANGRRMEVIDGTSDGSTTVPISAFGQNGEPIGNVEVPVEKPTSYRSVIHVENNNALWAAMPYGGEGKDHWFDKLYGFRHGDIITPSLLRSVNTPFADTDNDGYAKVRVRIHGTNDTPGVAPDHYDSLFINDVKIGDTSANGMVPYILEGELSNRSLQVANTLKIQTDEKTGILDKKYLDWVEVEYHRKFYTDNDYIDFPGIQMRPADYSVGGFSKNVVKMYDVTDPYEVKIINVPTSQITAEGSTYRVLFRRNEGREEPNYIMLTEGEVKGNLKIIGNPASDLRNPANGADYIIVTGETFIESLPPLVELRESQGYRVKLVNIRDVFDEFSYGVPGPISIKRFLQYAYDNWTAPAPAFVLLVGDASIDYFNDYQPPSNTPRLYNEVPTMIVTSETLNYIPSDNPYACVSGADSIPDLYLGRLSVRKKTDAADVISKIISYETRASERWNKTVLLISSNEQRFKDLNDRVVGKIPSGFNVDKLYVSSNGDMGSAINSSLESGALVTNFAGHGGITSWGNSGNVFYDFEDVANVANINKPTFLIALNCLNGYVGGFTLKNHTSDGVSWRISEPCLGESFLRSADKGAVAMFTATGSGFAEEQDIIDQKLMEEIFSRGNYLIGSAVTNAKILGVGELLQETIDTFILLGDPATKLKMQVPDAPTGLTVDGPLNSAPIIPTLSSAAYVDALGSPQIASRWQVTTVSGNYASPIYDSNKDMDDLTSIKIPAGILGRKVTYYWRVIHYSAFGASPPSAEQSFVVTGDADGDGADAESVGGGDCNDLNPNVSPEANELFDGIDNNCDGFIDEGFVDNDGDGYPPYSAGGQDCNDNDENINPAESEIVGDNIDNNCDGFVDDIQKGEPNTDHDGDGFSAISADARDCNDNNSNINPAATEVLDGIDNNCDGSVDEGFEGVPADMDGDGYFSPGDDCDDTKFSVHPGAEDVINGIDDNCDGWIDVDIIANPDAVPTVSEWGIIIMSAFFVIAFWKRNACA